MWTNPKRINLDSPFVYYISITDDTGSEYRYIGKARHKGRLKEYKRNMRKIRDRKQRASNQKYRAVHFVLYKAIENNWKIKFYPLEACSEGEVGAVEKRLIVEFGCNLNRGRMWAIEDICTLEIEDIVPNV